MPVLRDGSAHVWRISLDTIDPRDLWPTLSNDEQARANRFVRESNAHEYIVAHGMLRRILSLYESVPAESLTFVLGQYGKPALSAPASSGAPVEFNLSHSGDLALVAVTRGAPIGIDVERWDRDIDHLELAEQFFSPSERIALQSLAPNAERVAEGFFNAWTRKEAYLKATGHGITLGLHHFDVSLVPGADAALLEDRHDPTAPNRWRMSAVSVRPDYSAAVVAARGTDEIVLYDALSARIGLS